MSNKNLFDHSKGRQRMAECGAAGDFLKLCIFGDKSYINSDLLIINASTKAIQEYLMFYPSL
ncbi:MAG: hypothetical protein LBV16_09635 [Elusimicrobiota bacterium]|nr:hypothetical protein [Elusimicrobiota bacterium]